MKLNIEKLATEDTEDTEKNRDGTRCASVFSVANEVLE